MLVYNSEYIIHRLLSARITEMILSSSLAQGETEALDVTSFAQDHKAGLWQLWDRNPILLLPSLCSDTTQCHLCSAWLI